MKYEEPAFERYSQCANCNKYKVHHINGKCPMKETMFRHYGCVEGDTCCPGAPK